MINVLVFGVGTEDDRKLVKEIQRIGLVNDVPIKVSYEKSVDQMLKLNIKKTPSVMVNGEIYYNLSIDHLEKILTKQRCHD